jgi:hypothetical protein
MFTDKLYLETKSSHAIVDKHPFVSLIRKNKLAGEMYINFNKICIHEIQNVLTLKDEDLSVRLYRDFDVPDIFITKNLSSLLQHCRTYPLESAYQFYLGLLFGGNMLKRMIPEHANFLTYDNSKELINDFKLYLDNNIIDEDIFIQHVNEAYTIIKSVFDDFYNKFKYEHSYTPLDVQETGPLDGGPGTYPDPDTGLF